MANHVQLDSSVDVPQLSQLHSPQQWPVAGVSRNPPSLTTCSKTAYSVCRPKFTLNADLLLDTDLQLSVLRKYGKTVIVTLCLVDFYGTPCSCINKAIPLTSPSRVVSFDQ